MKIAAIFIGYTHNIIVSKCWYQSIQDTSRMSFSTSISRSMNLHVSRTKVCTSSLGVDGIWY